MDRFTNVCVSDREYKIANILIRNEKSREHFYSPPISSKLVVDQSSHRERWLNVIHFASDFRNVSRFHRKLANELPSPRLLDKILVHLSRHLLFEIQL